MTPLLDQVSAEELARLEVGTADWADLAFPDRILESNAAAAATKEEA